MTGTENYYRRTVMRLWRSHQTWSMDTISRVIHKGVAVGKYPKEFLLFKMPKPKVKNTMAGWDTRRGRIKKECTMKNHQMKLKGGMGYCNLCCRKLF